MIDFSTTLNLADESCTYPIQYSHQTLTDGMNLHQIYSPNVQIVDNTVAVKASKEDWNQPTLKSLCFEFHLYISEGKASN